ncbi:lysM domain receptor-like kinase 3 [Neltuma alba]|uniref:lysM domain receptor-like kinase 3 n=1 Tax=Neltuma alba TaxID=207710 RepID=UPI0010A4325E|nr:lysM domain receptor-like kinase 3 [Prosopis alba]
MSSFFLLLLLFQLCILRIEAKCRPKYGCELALASYYVEGENANLTRISGLFDQKIPDILKYNPNLRNPNTTLPAQIRLRLPFTCRCLNEEFLGHTFSYTMQRGDTYTSIAHKTFAGLTDDHWVSRVNLLQPNQIPTGTRVNVTVNCSCGDAHVSRDYGLFLTYPIRPGEGLSKVAAENGVPAELLQRYNPGSDFSAGLVFVPARDENGNYPPLKLRSGDDEDTALLYSRNSGGTIAAMVGGSISGTLLLGLLYFGLCRRKRVEDASFFTNPLAFEDKHNQIGHGSGNCSEKQPELVGDASPRLKGITVDKSVEFSYEELAEATNGFSMANKIGQGGFGSVYFAELRNEKVAIKKMDMQATKEFLTELKFLTHVHHLNLVRLIGYCVKNSLFLVYEYIENGNLSQHLRGSEREPLSWPSRVQIALDAARGLAYIHEQTVPVYIHGDIKSPNILIDKNFRGKVADFGQTNLTEYGSSSMPSHLVGTFGYLPPEYAKYGDFSLKTDVYAFGVVLYELISAKEAIVKTKEPANESKGLVALFQEVLNQQNPEKDLRELVDPRLGDNYPFDSVYKMCQLAKACTQENPQVRPSMRSIVVALVVLSSPSEDLCRVSYSYFDSS